MKLPRLFTKVLSRGRLLPAFNVTSVIDVNGKKFIIPLKGRQGYDNLRLSEPWMTQLLIAFKPIFNGHFIDVGVNIGQTLIKAQAVFNNPAYIGFEPNPVCVSYVQDLIKSNGFTDVLLLPVAVGAKTEMLKLNFFASDTSDSSASIIENFKQNTKPDHSIFVPVFDLRAITQFLPVKPSSILKIDVEGSELEVLMGLQEWIGQFHPIIILEILPVYTKDNVPRLTRQEKIEEMMQSLDYKIARINKVPEVQLKTIAHVGIHSNIDDCDYVLYHSSFGGEIEKCFKHSL